MKQATLCFLIKEGSGGKEVLLAMKKRGFGKGKWNGVGGKLDFSKGDRDIIDAAIRETKEEIKIDPKEVEKVGVLNFYFPYIKGAKSWDQQVHVFLVRNWKGEPQETEEMAPQWFQVSALPFSSMWSDDKFWLPYVLRGEKIMADFVFKPGERVEQYKIKPVKTI